MKALRRKWHIDVLHHSHTDIGYTDYQEKMELYHADYLRQVLGILDAIDRGERPGCEGFKWQCENIWQVENFYKFATEAEKRACSARVAEGRIAPRREY